MIERLDIGNLRSFAGEQQVPMSKITLIYGQNSAGKSSLIKTLGLLKQTLEQPGALSQVDRPSLLLEGDTVDFGSFKNVIHRHKIDRELTLGLKFATADEQRSTYAGFGFKAATGAAGVSQGHPEGVVQVSADLGDGEDGRVRFVRDLERDRFTLDHDGVKSLGVLIEAGARDLRERGDESTAQEIAYLRDQLLEQARVTGLLAFLPAGFFPALAEPQMFANSRTNVRFGAWFESSMFDFVFGLGELMENLAYLGPLRAAPSRFQTLSRSGAWLTQVGPSGEHVTRLLVDKPEILERVNHWLEVELEMAYTLHVRRIDAEGDVQIGDLVATALLDRRSDTFVTPQDVGFGISQLMPVVVQLLANAKGTICIEQPEIHIHPRLQARIADLVLESIDPHGLDNQVVIETHSEHLIRRLQTRLRSPHERPEFAWLRPEDIAVIYVDVDAEGNAIPVRIRLNADGEFMDPWPGGFFDERYEEIFGREIWETT